MFFKSNGFQSLLHQFINTIIGHNYFVKYWLAGPDKVNKWLNRPTTHIIAGKLGANLKKWLPLGEIMFELHTIAEWINFVHRDKQMVTKVFILKIETALRQCLGQYFAQWTVQLWRLAERGFFIRQDGYKNYCLLCQYTGSQLRAAESTRCVFSLGRFCCRTTQLFPVILADSCDFTDVFIS